MSRNEVLTYRDVASSTKRIPKGPLREVLLQTLCALIAGTLMAVLISGFVYWFRFSLPSSVCCELFLTLDTRVTDRQTEGIHSESLDSCASRHRTGKLRRDADNRLNISLERPVAAYVPTRLSVVNSQKVAKFGDAK